MLLLNQTTFMGPPKDYVAPPHIKLLQRRLTNFLAHSVRRKT